MERAQIGFFVEDGKKDGDVRRVNLDHLRARIFRCRRNTFCNDRFHHAAVRSFSSIHRLTSLSVVTRFFLATARTLLKSFPSIAIERVRSMSTSTSTGVKYSL